jgi:hypothetical protein
MPGSMPVRLEDRIERFTMLGGALRVAHDEVFLDTPIFSDIKRN